MTVQPGKQSIAGPMWSCLLDAEKPLTVRELQELAGATVVGSTDSQVRKWAMSGLLKRLPGRPARYILTPGAANRYEPLRKSPDLVRQEVDKTARQKVWLAMRVLKTFDVPALLMTTGASKRSIQSLLNQLQRANYVSIERRGNRLLGGWSTYRLRRDTGRLCPAVNHRGDRIVITDRNNGRRVDISPGTVSLGKSSKPAPVGGGVG